MNLFTRNIPYYHLLKYLLFLLKHPVFMYCYLYELIYSEYSILPPPKIFISSWNNLYNPLETFMKWVHDRKVWWYRSVLSRKLLNGFWLNFRNCNLYQWYPGERYFGFYSPTQILFYESHSKLTPFPLKFLLCVVTKHKISLIPTVCIQNVMLCGEKFWICKS